MAMPFIVRMTLCGGRAQEGSCWYGAIGSFAQYAGCHSSTGGIPGPVCAATDELCDAVVGYCTKATGAACGWRVESHYFIVSRVALYARIPIQCNQGRACSQPPPFSCSGQFKLVSHVVIQNPNTDTVQDPQSAMSLSLMFSRTASVVDSIANCGSSGLVGQLREPKFVA